MADALQGLHSSLDSVANILDNRLPLDYLLPEEGEVCTVKTCYMGVNNPGQIKVNTKHRYEQAQWSHRYNTLQNPIQAPFSQRPPWLSLASSISLPTNCYHLPAHLWAGLLNCLLDFH